MSSDTITLVSRESSRLRAGGPRRARVVTLDDLMNGKWSIDRELDERVLQAFEQAQSDRHQAAMQLAAWIEETSAQRVDPPRP